MGAEGESLSDSQSEVSNASDELTSSESSILDRDSDSNNNNDISNASQSLEREKPCLIGRVLVTTRNSIREEEKKPTKKTADKGITLLLCG